MSSIASFVPVLKGQLEGGRAALEGYWTPSEIEAACEDQRHVWRDRFWTPLRTISGFLLQVLHAGSSCREAVALTLGQEAAGGPKDRPLPSDDPSAYVQARKRLPLEVLRAGVRQIGQRLRDEVASTLTWCGRRVWLVDGTTCSMPDTPDLQETFGQPSGQAKGCGFPVAKVVGLFCWASGAVIEAAVGPLRMSELTLWRTLWPHLSPGEIVLGDRFYCTFYDIVGVMRRGCDAVFRLHGSRPADLRRGRRLGARDRVVIWQRPTWNLRPRGMRRREWKGLPETLTLRLIRFSVDIRGFRSRSITVATTLLDPAAYPASRIAALYRDRWLIELRFRDIKTTLGMDVLRGKSADVVRKEIFMHLMAYNLIRALMWQAAARHGVALHRLSFAGAVDRLNSLLPYLWLYEGSRKAQRLYELLLQWIARDALPDRPNRLEPRVLKRRPKRYTFLKRPRQQLRRILLSRRVSYA
jgi:hypothetical protein